jgi:hypothetical protein
MSRTSKGKLGLQLIDGQPIPADFPYDFEESADEGTDVYVLDTGCNISHDEFAPNRAECFHDVFKGSCKDDDGREYLGPHPRDVLWWSGHTVNIWC